MKINYHWYNDPQNCEAKIPFLSRAMVGSVACQGCDHFIDFERDVWVDCAINAGRTDEKEHCTPGAES